MDSDISVTLIILTPPSPPPPPHPGRRLRRVRSCRDLRAAARSMIGTAVVEEKGEVEEPEATLLRLQQAARRRRSERQPNGPSRGV